MCNVIHIRDKKGTDDEVYIGRGSKWGNPYKIGRDGNRQQVISQYAKLMNDRLNYEGDAAEQWIADLLTLHGKTLVCFCKPQVCHGDILAQLVEEYVKCS